MKKLVFTMDDFGIHESISYLLRDILRDKIQRMYDENVNELIAEYEEKMVQYANKLFLAEQKAVKFESLYEGFKNESIVTIVTEQGGSIDSRGNISPTEGNGEVRDIPDQN